jgi:anti-anti-sigma regulatory factor
MCAMCVRTSSDHDRRSSRRRGPTHIAVVGYRLVDESAVVEVTGVLDAAAIHPSRAALDAAINSGYPVVVDLVSASPPDRVSLALLGAMRRYVRVRGATMTLTNVPGTWLEAMRRTGVIDLFTHPENDHHEGDHREFDHREWVW